MKLWRTQLDTKTFLPKGKPIAFIWIEEKVPSMLKPFTPTSDQDRISPYKINTISSREVMRIEKNINHGIISWSNTKFSELTS